MTQSELIERQPSLGAFFSWFEVGRTKKNIVRVNDRLTQLRATYRDVFFYKLFEKKNTEQDSDTINSQRIRGENNLIDHKMFWFTDDCHMKISRGGFANTYYLKYTNNNCYINNIHPLRERQSFLQNSVTGCVEALQIALNYRKDCLERILNGEMRLWIHHLHTYFNLKNRINLASSF